MSRRDIQIIDIHTLEAFKIESQVGPYQLVTGYGALSILSKMNDIQAEFCLANCVFSHSAGDKGAAVENLLDDIESRLELYKDDRFFPTTSGSGYEELIWVMKEQSIETPRILAVSTRNDFGLEVASWFDRAEAQLAEEATK